jgi:ribonuclease E
MHDVMKELKLPSGMGFILRTAGEDRTKRDLQRDLNYLLRLWRTVADHVRRLPAPAELYRESDLVTRAIRDVYTLDFDRLVVDDAETARRAQEFIQIAMPRAKTSVEFYSGREPLFHRFGIEDEIEKINMRHVPLPSGGYLVVDTTEALVAIDVNSGRFRATADAEETAFRINMEAAVEIARQLRLRDLGGLILCDFIDMRQERHMRAVEKALRDELKNHKERARILRMSAFGIIEMTRQRQGPSIKRNLYDDCPHCKGTGLVKMPESIMLDVMRTVQRATNRDEIQVVTITVAHEVALQILNSKRAHLAQTESETGKAVIIRGDPSFTGDQIEVLCQDASGRGVEIGLGGANERPRGRGKTKES